MKPLLALIMIALAHSAHAQPLDLEAIAKVPGTEVTKRIVNGEEVVEIHRAGVTVTVMKDGRRVGVDNSGHGAVLCVWEILVASKAAADICFPGEFTELSSLFGEVIESFNDFIVANSLTPVTKADLKARLDERTSRVRAGSPACISSRQNFLEPFNKEVKSKSRAEARSSFEKTLATPRPPAMNPCL